MNGGIWTVLCNNGSIVHYWRGAIFFDDGNCCRDIHWILIFYWLLILFIRIKVMFTKYTIKQIWLNSIIWLKVLKNDKNWFIFNLRAYYFQYMLHDDSTGTALVKPTTALVCGSCISFHLPALIFRINRNLEPTDSELCRRFKRKLYDLAIIKIYNV